MQLLPTIRKCQAEWLGHVAGMSPDRLPNIALLGYAPGKLHQGHHPKAYDTHNVMHFCCNITTISHCVQADVLDVNSQRKSQASASTSSYTYVPPSTKLQLQCK